MSCIAEVSIGKVCVTILLPQSLLFFKKKPYNAVSCYFILLTKIKQVMKCIRALLLCRHLRISVHNRPITVLCQKGRKTGPASVLWMDLSW